MRGESVATREDGGLVHSAAASAHILFGSRQQRRQLERIGFGLAVPHGEGAESDRDHQRG